MNKETIIGYAASFSAVVMWSFNGIISTAFAGRMSPLEITFGRWFIASLILLPFAVHAIKHHWTVLKKSGWVIIGMAATGIVFNNLVMYYAGHTTSALNISLMNRLTPLFLVFLTAFFMGWQICLKQIAGIVLAVFGVGYILFKGDLDNVKNLHLTPGDLWMLLTAFSFAVYSMLQYKRPAALSQVDLLAVTALAATVGLSPVAIYAEIKNPHVMMLSGMDWGILLYLGVGLSIIGYLAWNTALQKLGAIKASMMSYITPLLTSIWAVFLLGDTLHGSQFIGGVFVLVGILIVNRSSRFKDGKVYCE